MKQSGLLVLAVGVALAFPMTCWSADGPNAMKRMPPAKSGMVHHMPAMKAMVVHHDMAAMKNCGKTTKATHHKTKHHRHVRHHKHLAK